MIPDNHLPQGARSEQLRRVKTALLQGKTWRYLRYLHARSAMLLVADRISSVVVVGAGHGLAELALAIEFPGISFMLTDWEAATHSTESAKLWSKEWRVDNVRFSSLDILRDVHAGEYDMAYSVEVLEHIKDDRRAADNMRKLARRYAFCLVPFAEDARNSNPESRAHVLAKHGHHVCGYNPRMLLQLFPHPVAIRGTYWAHTGAVFRNTLSAMSSRQINDSLESLTAQAEADLIDRIPVQFKEAQGIWWLSRTDV
jgi:hypothetical protein